VAAQGDFKIGLSEVQVGLPLPPVTFAALRRLVGPRADAATLGLVDEVVPAEQVVDRAIKWCQDLLALPQSAMNLTRTQARGDLVAVDCLRGHAILSVVAVAAVVLGVHLFVILYEEPTLRRKFGADTRRIVRT